MPLPELAEREGQPAAEASAGERREEAPSVPFTGFSLLALALSGTAALASGRRLRSATMTSPVGTGERVTEEGGCSNPRIAWISAATPARPLVIQRAPVSAPAPRRRRAPLYVGVALLGLAAVAAASRTGRA
jgi:hypothetical protein